jgi:hypothetical protein
MGCFCAMRVWAGVLCGRFLLASGDIPSHKGA